MYLKVARRVNLKTSRHRKKKCNHVRWWMLTYCGIYFAVCIYRTSLITQLVKKSACSAGVPGLIPGLERSPGEGNGNPLQYSCLENPTGRGAWWAAVHGVTRVGHNWATKPPPCVYIYIKSWCCTPKINIMLYVSYNFKTWKQREKIPHTQPRMLVCWGLREKYIFCSK